jgi:hypothetical protein
MADELDLDPELDLDLPFEPDEIAEEELADEEPIDKALISDETVRQCRFISSIRCVEYGMIGDAPGMLLLFAFVFHPKGSRVKRADVELRFNKGTITALQPQVVDDNESEVTVRTKLEGHFDMSHPPISAGLSASRETEKKKVYAREIRGSGRDTELAAWTLRENSDLKAGIHLNFMTAMILKAEGAVEVDVEVRATLGANLRDPLGIRKVISQRPKKFDGKTNLGRRPERLVTDGSVFIKRLT